MTKGLTYSNSQLPANVRQAMQMALREELERRNWSTYQLAAALQSSQSTVYTATEYGKMGILFANKVLDWLGTDTESVLRRFNLHDQPAGQEAVPSIRALGAKMNWSECTIAQLELLYKAAGENIVPKDLKRVGSMFQAMNMEFIE